MKTKRAATILACALMAFTLAACGNSGSNDASKASDNAATSDVANTDAGNKSGKESAPDWKPYDDLVAQIKMEQDGAKREALMHQAEDMLMDSGAVIPLYFYNDLYLEKQGFAGDYATVFGTKYFMYTTKDGQPIDVMKINLASEPDHLDPALNTTVDGASLASNSFVGLYMPDKTNPSAYVPAMAAEMPQVSDDGLTYTIKMKSDLKWSDGTPLTANDFVYSWKRGANPDTASDYAYLFDVFAQGEDGTIDVSAPDDTTLTFKLKAPTSYMMNLLAFPIFMPVPQAAVEAASDWQTNPGSWAAEAGFVSNGAYTLKEWKHNESMTYVKNPNYFDADNVTVNELHFMLSADDTAILAAFTSGDIDYADTVPTGEVANLKSTPEFHVIPNLGTYYVGFNVNSPMFAGKTVDQAKAMRKAINLLIDRQFIVDTIGQTGQEVATSFVPTGISDGHGGEYRNNDADYSYPVPDAKGYFENKVDIPQAIELLKQAGYKFDDNNMLSAETPLNIKYLTNEGSGHEAIAQAIQQNVAAVGITMDISTEDWQTFLNDRKAGNYDVGRNGWLADFDDPVNFLELAISSSGNNDMQLGK